MNPLTSFLFYYYGCFRQNPRQQNSNLFIYLFFCSDDNHGSEWCQSMARHVEESSAATPMRRHQPPTAYYSKSRSTCHNLPCGLTRQLPAFWCHMIIVVLVPSHVIFDACVFRMRWWLDQLQTFTNLCHGPIWLIQRLWWFLTRTFSKRLSKNPTIYFNKKYSVHLTMTYW